MTENYGAENLLLVTLLSGPMGTRLGTNNLRVLGTNGIFDIRRYYVY